MNIRNILLSDTSAEKLINLQKSLLFVQERIEIENGMEVLRPQTKNSFIQRVLWVHVSDFSLDITHNLHIYKRVCCRAGVNSIKLLQLKPRLHDFAFFASPRH